MPQLPNYLDYRVFLKDYYEARKKSDSYFSYRYMARKLELDAGYIVKLLQEKVHIAEKSIPAICKLCKLSSRDSKYFETLVAFNKSKQQEQSRLLFEKLLSFKEVGAKTLRREQYEYYQKWYYTAIRAYIGCGTFTGDFVGLAKALSPAITVKQAEKAVMLLIRLGLVKKTKNSFNVTERFITTGKHWHSLAVRTFQEEVIELARQSLQRHDKALRDISTVTVSIAPDDLPEIRDRIRDFRSSILKLAGDTEAADRVYQLNVQFFPLTSNSEDTA